MESNFTEKYNIPLIATVLAGIGILVPIYIGYNSDFHQSSSFSVSMAMLFAGMIVESLRLSDSWKSISLIFVGAYLFSLFTFLTIQNKSTYNIDILVDALPFMFIFYFTIIFAFIFRDKVTAKLSEGVTLLQTLAIVYWILDAELLTYKSWWTYALLAVVCIFSLFASINAFTNLHLSENIRIMLSMWSSIIMMIFAVDNIIDVFNQPDLNATLNNTQMIDIGVRYFLLGVSSLYMMQNYLLLISFIPGKKDKYSTDSERISAAARELEQSRQEHLSRYSDNQVIVSHAVLCILYASSIFGINYFYNVVSKQSAIWLVFFSFPLIISGLKKIKI
ncbi:MAG: hypothetical protein KBF35_11580 [Saprospiraceae bacterium]|nr:hypothetical protein [Saprospiraceae bacterium]